MNKTQQKMKRLVRNAQAVSPIIATLMLVLVAVGAAGAFYVWQSGWQSDVQSDMTGFDTKANLLIGGSSTVYEFTAVAAPMFERERGDIKVSYQAGGSGSGVIGVGEGVVDIGSASRYIKADEYAKYPNLVEHTVAYDAIVMIVSASNPRTIPGLTIIEIQAVYYINGGVYDTDPLPTGVPAAVGTWRTDHSAADAIAYQALPITPKSPFYFNTDENRVYWATGNDVLVNIYERADHSGTEDVFCHKLLKGDEKQLDEQTYPINCPPGNKKTGNAALLTALKNDPNGLSFMSFGAAKDAGSSVVKMLSIDFGSGSSYIAPTETAIKKPVGDPLKYESYRPINYITNGQPTGYAKIYLDFVRGTLMNQDIAKNCGYMSVY